MALSVMSRTTLFPKLVIGMVSLPVTLSMCLDPKEYRRYIMLTSACSLGEENPSWVANRVLSFFNEGDTIPSVDLSGLDDKVSLIEEFAMGNIPGRK